MKKVLCTAILVFGLPFFTLPTSKDLTPDTPDTPLTSGGFI